MGLRQKLASQTGFLFIVRLGGAGLQFLCQALMAKLWGAELLGIYLVALATSNLLSGLLPLGFQTIASYFAADYLARGDGTSLRRFARRAYGHVLGPGLVVIVLGYGVVSVWGAETIDLKLLWFPIAILAFGAATIFINGALLVGLKRPFAGFLADTIFRPLIIVGAFGVVTFWLYPDDKITTFLWLLALLYLVVALIHFTIAVLTISRIPQDPEAIRPNEQKRWWRLAIPWMIISLSTDLFFDLDLLMLTLFLDAEQIAVFGICTRIFILIGFSITVVYSIVVPDLMKAEANRNDSDLMGRLADANLVSCGVSVVLVTGIVIIGPFVMRLFGPEFEAGVIPLMILSLILVVRSIFGPTSIMLSARDHASSILPAVFLGLGALLLGNVLLLPLFGLVGAAFAALLSSSVTTFLLWRTTRRLTGLDVSVFPALMKFIAQKN